jgi:hypothetical protein
VTTLTGDFGSTLLLGQAMVMMLTGDIFGLAAFLNSPLHPDILLRCPA